jgi:hypothetical protein
MNPQIITANTFCRSAQNGLGDMSLSGSATVPFARNDLLFTMSDNTHRRTLHGEARSLVRICFLTDEHKPVSRDRRWWSQTGSNRRPPACKAGALPTELWPLVQRQTQIEAPSCKQRVAFASEGWWAWEDLNFRPHAYQARALTN